MKQVFNRQSNFCSLASSGDLGDRWRYGHVTVQSYSQFQVAFEGTVGTSYQVGFRCSNVDNFEMKCCLG